MDELEAILAKAAADREEFEQEQERQRDERAKERLADQAAERAAAWGPDVWQSLGGALPRFVARRIAAFVRVAARANRIERLREAIEHFSQPEKIDVDRATAFVFGMAIDRLESDRKAGRLDEMAAQIVRIVEMLSGSDAKANVRCSVEAICQRTMSQRDPAAAPTEAERVPELHAAPGAKLDSLTGKGRQAAAPETVDDGLDNYIPAKDCRTSSVNTRDKLDSLIEREKLRTKNRGRRKYVHAGDWHAYKQRAEKSVQAILDDPESADVIDEFMERKQMAAARKKQRHP